MGLVFDGGGGGGIPSQPFPGTDHRIVPDIATRNALEPELSEGDIVLVADASADPTVDMGYAVYAYQGIPGAWLKLSEWEAFTEQLAPTLAALQTTAHMHNAAIADIDDAAAKRHDHVNKTLLDTLVPHTWGGADVNGTILKVPELNGLPLPRMTDTTVSIIVAPDAASRQPGDWGTTGWAGVVSAVRAAAAVLQGNGAMVIVRLRPGVYTADSVLSVYPTTGARIRIEALTAPTLPTTWSFSNGGTPNRAADEAALEAAYPVRIDVASWTCVWAVENAAVFVRNILFKAVGAGTGSALRARGGSFVYADNCAYIGGGTAIGCDNNACIQWNGGVIFAGTAAAFSTLGGNAHIASYTGSVALIAHSSTGLQVSRNGVTSAIADTVANSTQFAAIERHVASAYDRGTVSVINANLDRVATNASFPVFYASTGSHVEANAVVFSGNVAEAMQVVRGSSGKFYNCTFDAAAPAQARTVRANSNSTIWEAGTVGNTPVFVPAKGTEATDAGYIA